MVRELEALKLAGISVFSVAVSNRADESDVRGISSVPQLANINYFLSPTITNLNSLSGSLASQVCSILFACTLSSINKPTLTPRRRNEASHHPLLAPEAKNVTVYIRLYLPAKRNLFL